MEVTALCFTLWLSMWMLLTAFLQTCCHAQRAALPGIDGNRLQLFELESFTVHCEHVDSLSEWRVIRKLKTETNSTEWGQSTGSLTIRAAFSSDSGEYWCEDEYGERSHSINITVTGGDVVLQSPAAVLEGDRVTLLCRHKVASNLPADFYKDGRLLATGYDGQHVINGVSKADEGLYRCSLSGYEPSAESWLTVRESMDSPPPTARPETSSPSPSPFHGSIFLSAVLLPLCVAVLLLVLGLLCCHRHRLSGEECLYFTTVTYTAVQPSGQRASRSLTSKLDAFIESTLKQRYRRKD